VTATLKGEVADEFMKIAEEAGLNKSQLALQMIYHALNKTEDLKDFYRRLAILAE
jgi:serine/threonine protein kinase HipA of HipAB toxin-antitoxin module